MRIIGYIAMAAVCLLAAVALPQVFLPKRWQEIHPGQHRQQVTAVLGGADPSPSFTNAG